MTRMRVRGGGGCMICLPQPRRLRSWQHADDLTSSPWRAVAQAAHGAAALHSNGFERVAAGGVCVCGTVEGRERPCGGGALKEGVTARCVLCVIYGARVRCATCVGCVGHMYGFGRLTRRVWNARLPYQFQAVHEIVPSVTATGTLREDYNKSRQVDARRWAGWPGARTGAGPTR